MINRELFEKLCALQCSRQEIIDTFNCSYEILNKWCNEVYKTNFQNIYTEKSTKGKVSLRNLQFKLAEKSATMAIYLGKVYLNQKEKE